jgi:hypothetical protein
VDLGPFDDDTLDNEGDITWTVQRSPSKLSGNGSTTAHILSIVTAHPFEHTTTQIVDQCPGKKDTADGVFTSMMFNSQIEKQHLPRLEGNRMVRRDVWGPRTTPLASVTPWLPASGSPTALPEND